MEFESYLQQLFAYDDWANREALRSLEQAASKASARAKKLIAHIIAAEWLWMDRITGDPQRTAVWPELSLAECRQQLEKLQAAWQQFFRERGAQLASEFSYKNSKGESFRSRVQDVLMHVVLHSAYHRGQIAADVRAAGAEPAYTDFIHAVRQGFVTAA
jgi:uncharacterized damage-inducible protein DinB